MATSLNHRLTIQFALDGFSFAIFDNTNNKLLAWDCHQSDRNTVGNELFNSIEKAIADKGFDGIKHYPVTFIIDERTNILVPEAIYSRDDNSKLLGFSFNTANDIVSQADTLTKHKVVNVFALARDLKEKVLAKWPEATITHSSSLFLESLPESAEPAVYVNVRHHDFDIAIMKNRLQFFNNFQFNDKNDFAYFLLNVLQQQNISSKSTTVCFSGQILPTSEIIGLCGQFVKDIQFVERPDTLQVDEAFAEVPYQYYHIQYQAIR